VWLTVARGSSGSKVVGARILGMEIKQSHFRVYPVSLGSYPGKRGPTSWSSAAWILFSDTGPDVPSS
jgi:hypothetical protein